MAIDLTQLEQQYDLPKGLLAAVQKQEDANADPNAVSPAGAIGPFQFMPDTAKAYGVQDPKDYDQAAVGAAKMFADLQDQYDGDPAKMLAAYNWGSGNLDKHGLDKAPAETKNYVANIMGKLGNIMMPSAQAQEAAAPAAVQQPAQAPKAEDMLDSLLGAKPAQQPAAIKAEDMLDNLLNAPKQDAGTDAKLGSGEEVIPGKNAHDVPTDKIDQAIRQTGLSSRDFLSAAASPITGAGDIANTTINGITGLVNKVAGTNIPQLGMPSQDFSNVLTKAGLPQPESTSEKIGSGVSQTALGLSTLGEDLLPLGKALYNGAKNIAVAVGKGEPVSLDALKQFANAHYKAADEIGGAYGENFSGKFLDKIAGDAPKTPTEIIAAKSDPVRNFASEYESIRGKPMTLSDAQLLDEKLGDLIDSNTDPIKGMNKDAVKLKEAQNQLRDMIHNPDAEDVVGGTAGADALKAGRQAWSQAMKARDVERVMTRAQYSQNPATTLQSGFRTMLTSASKTRGWSQEEMDALKQAAKTGYGTDILRMLGGRLVPYAAAMIGEHAGGPVGAAVAAGVGHGASTAARNAASKIQMGKAQNVMQTLGKNLTSSKTPALATLDPSQGTQAISALARLHALLGGGDANAQ